MALVQLFKGLSDPVRFRIVHLLTQRDELCVCHLTDALSLPQSTVSRHLNTLKSCGLVEAERRGKWVYYRMMYSDNYVRTLSDLVKASSVDDKQLKNDFDNLKDSSC